MNDGRVCARCCVRVCLCACVYVCVMHVGEAVFQLLAPRGQFPFRSPPVRAYVRACVWVLCHGLCMRARGEVMLAKERLGWRVIQSRASL